jgi:hypothetical protein
VSYPVAPSEPVAAAVTIEPAFVPKTQELPVLPPNPAPSATNENRIIIGRVEVQVNNRLPQLPIVSLPEPVKVSRPASFLLEAHFLDRFFLRP